MNETRKQKVDTVFKNRHKGMIVVLEDTHDPHNAAAILRTCDALGIQNVYFIFEKEKEYDPKMIGKASSATANKWLDFRIFHSTSQCFKTLKQEGFTIIGTALSHNAESLKTAIFPEDKIALVVGNEKEGLSHYALNHVDRTIIIPMIGFVQSLNVSVATAIILWEITKAKLSLQNLSKKA